MSLNKVILIGRLGKDPELKHTESGHCVGSFSLATSEKFLSKDGQKREKTEWHNIIAWDKQAELAEKYLKKGQEVYIEGRIETRSWDDRDGNKRNRTEIKTDKLVFIGTGSNRSDSAPAPSAQPVDQESTFEGEDLPF